MKTPPLSIEKKTAPPDGGFLAMAGWHPNYCDFSSDGTKGSVTFINGTITVIINHKVSYSIELKDLLEFLVEDARGGS